MNLFKERLKAFFRYKDLFLNLIQRDLKLKYRRSFLGYLWSILNPLGIMVVMSIVFSAMFKRNIPHYPIYLLTGQLLFSYMREATSHALNSITGNAALLKKTYVPKYMFTLSQMTSDFVNMLLSLISLFIVMLVTQLKFTGYFALIFIPLLELYVFTVGLGLFLAQLSVFFRDIKYIWGVFCTAWMYLTPLFYEVDFLPGKLKWLVSHLNPMYYYITIFRDYTWLGNDSWFPNIVRGGIIAAIMLIIGCVSFAKTKNKFILYI
ncbi:MAG: ABC transporter permease [Spirochaetaceae bacterium]|jgi:lipopolysaccharide transport system permease protein|nr:ABC transporter permease [Spirochaetaceae bacterium]